MKVLIVCQHFYPENFRVNDIAFALVEKGHDVSVLTGLPNYPQGKVLPEYRWFKNRKQKVNGVHIHRCSLVGRRTSTIMMGINYMWFAFFGCIKALFMKGNFDVVYVYQLSPITMAWPALVIKKRKKIPVVLHCLDQWPVSVTTGPISKESFLYKILHSISVWTYQKADTIIISSKAFKHYFEEVLHISKEEKGLLYYPSYAESDYENVPVIQNEQFDLVFAGNIGPAQSVETIIEAANLVKDNKQIKFHIVGDGLSRNKCEALAKEYQLDNVIFYGYHPVEEMPAYYGLADAFLITMVDNEVVNSTLPAKVQSYMLAGKPIIGAINGEVKSVIEEAKCGLCCASLQFDSLAQLILNAYNNRDEFNALGKNAYEYYKANFEKDICIQNLENIFKDVISLKGV